MVSDYDRELRLFSLDADRHRLLTQQLVERRRELIVAALADGMTQTQVAAALGITRQRVAAIAGGNTNG